MLVSSRDAFQRLPNAFENQLRLCFGLTVVAPALTPAVGPCTECGKLSLTAVAPRFNYGRYEGLPRTKRNCIIPCL